MLIINTSPIILIVDDNAITLKLIRLILEAENFQVLTATSGQECLKIVSKTPPHLILIDFRLPDMNGSELATLLRSLPHLIDTPLIAFTGFIPNDEKETKMLAIFNGYVVKPVDPLYLQQLIRSFLSPSTPTHDQPGKGQLVVIADDDLIQLKLIRIHFESLGFNVVTAPNGKEAFDLIQFHLEKTPPALVVSDILMPVMDGLKLCVSLKQSAALASIPVILMTNNYLEKEDREFALNLGASDLIVRTPDMDSLVQAAIFHLNQKQRLSQVKIKFTPEMEFHYQQRVFHQLERQAAMNISLAQQCSLQATALAILGTIADSVSKNLNIEQILPQILAQCIDGAGLSVGMIYLIDKNHLLRLQAQIGLSVYAEQEAQRFFGHSEYLLKIMEKGETVAQAKDERPNQMAEILKQYCHSEYGLIIPLISRTEKLGVLIMASPTQNLTHRDWLTFAKPLSIQIGDAISLGRTLSNLRTSELRYRSFMENANDAKFVLNSMGIITEVNSKAVDLLGHPKNKMIGSAYADFVDPSQADYAKSEFNRIPNESRINSKNIRLVCANGKIVEVDFSSSIVSLDEEMVILCIARDVTERNLLENQLRQSQKMEAIGLLAGGVAHDFNNILMVMGLYAESASKLATEAKLKDNIEKILITQKRGATLTRQLLAFSHKSVISPELLDLNHIIGEMKDMVERLIGENILFEFKSDQKLESIFVDRSYIEQIIMNLAVNARDAMPKGGEISLFTENILLPASDLPPINGPVIPGKYVHFVFSDSGEGMRPEILEKIFQPFFTTKGVGKGTGLGLSTVIGIVQQAKGYLTVSSEVNVGTQFHLYFPCSDNPDKIFSIQKRQDEVVNLLGNEVVLYIEDELFIRELCTEEMSDKGYQVYPFADGVEALANLKKIKSKIDLVITDIMLPGMSGVDLVNAILQINPEIKVLFISGYTADILEKHNIDLAKTSFMAKPFLIENFLIKMRGLLDS